MTSSTGSTISSSGGGGGAPVHAPAIALSAPLAPGFRFHPTDEELVSYYLKRKVLGRPLRVDAITEIDLYKCDPWDLPSRSRIRSRDGEWYFFSPLDKKYANGSGKTNRATGRGYWKTTGKDRAVRSGRGRDVGMKKTLVFHVGKAPKGERTNWVMHEYRLEGDYDDLLRQAGVSQDSYVVCRIFQKAGPGPMNGAQYGAPYVEEEWQEYDDFDAGAVLPVSFLPPPDPSALPASAPAAVAPVSAPEDFKDLLEEQGVDSFNGSVGSLLEVNDERNDFNNMDSVGMDGDNSVLESNQVLDFSLENYIQPEGFSTDDYLELKDFVDPIDLYLSPQEGTNPSAGAEFGHIEVPSDMFGRQSDLPATSNVQAFPYIAKEEAELMQADPFSNHSSSFEMDDILNFETQDYLVDGEASDGFLYSNARNQMEEVDGFSNKESAYSQHPVMSESSSTDPFDDIMAFFDAPEDSAAYTPAHSSRLATEGDVVALQKYQPDISGGNWSPASKTEPPVISQANIEHFDVYARDAQSDSSSSKSTITRRLWSMLDSVSAPPALAAEAPLLAKSLVIDPAAWMKANNLTLEGYGKSPSSKASKDNAPVLESCFRMHNRVTSWMIRNGCSLCVSVLLLAASVKMGRCYSRLFFM